MRPVSEKCRGNLLVLLVLLCLLYKIEIIGSASSSSPSLINRKKKTNASVVQSFENDNINNNEKQVESGGGTEDGKNNPLWKVRSLIPEQLPSKNISVIGGGSIIGLYKIYDTLLKHFLRRRFLCMELLSYAAAVENDNNDTEGSVVVVEALLDLIHKMTYIRSRKQLTKVKRLTSQDNDCDNNNHDNDDQEKTEEPQEGRYELLWYGKLPSSSSQTNERGLLKNGWYSAGRGQTSIYVHIDHEEEKQTEGGTAACVSVFTPKLAPSEKYASSPQMLFAARKPRTIIAGVKQKLKWQRFLKSVLVGKNDDDDDDDDNATTRTTTTNALQPGTYHFVYREYVNIEEFSVMVSERGGWIPFGAFRATSDSIFVLQEDGHCFMQDRMVRFGFIPTLIRNTGRWSNHTQTIVWDKNSIRYGWKGRFLGKTTEIKAMTELLRAHPWEWKAYWYHNGDDSHGNTTSDGTSATAVTAATNGSSNRCDVLFVYRPGKGWLVWKKT